MPTFAFPTAPANLTINLRRNWNAPLPIYYILQLRYYALCPIIIHARPLD